MAFNQVMAVALLIVALGYRGRINTKGAIVNIDDESSGSQKQRLQQHLSNPANTGNNSAKLSAIANSLLNKKCKQLAIVMSGDEKKFFFVSGGLHWALRGYDIPDYCIVVVTYKEKAEWFETIDGKTYGFPKGPPTNHILGEHFDDFVTELFGQFEKLDTKNNQDRGNATQWTPFNGVFLTFNGHGGENLIATHPPPGTSKYEFMKAVIKLKTMSKNMLIVLDACFSASMFLKDNAQLLTNKEALFASSEAMIRNEWAPETVKGEVRRLTERWKDLEDILKAILTIVICITYLPAEKAKHQSSLTDLKDDILDPELEPRFKFGLKLTLNDIPVKPDLRLDFPEKFPVTSYFIDQFSEPGTKHCLEDIVNDNGKFERWLVELSRIEESVLGDRASVYSGVRFLHGMIRLSAPHLKQPRRPVDMLKTMLEQEKIPGQCMAITSAHPTTTCRNQNWVRAMYDYLKKHKEDMNVQTMESMYAEIRKQTVKHIVPSDDKAVEEKKKDDEKVICRLPDYATRDFITCAFVVPETRAEVGFRAPHGITLGFGKGDLDTNLDNLFPTAAKKKAVRPAPCCSLM